MLILPNGPNDISVLMTYHHGCNFTITIFILQIIVKDFVTAHITHYRCMLYSKYPVLTGQLTDWVALFYYAKSSRVSRMPFRILRASEEGGILPCASSFRCSLINAALATSFSAILGGLFFLWQELKGSSVRRRSRLLERPPSASIAKIQGPTSSSFSKHHCKPWKSAISNVGTKLVFKKIQSRINDRVHQWIQNQFQSSVIQIGAYITIATIKQNKTKKN